jgi:hypothetical protein
VGGGHGIFVWKRASRPCLSISPNRRSSRIERLGRGAAAAVSAISDRAMPVLTSPFQTCGASIEEASPGRDVEPAHAAKEIAPANPVTDPTLVALRVIENLRRSGLHSADTLNIIFGQEVFCAAESGEVYIMRKVETLGKGDLTLRFTFA